MFIQDIRKELDGELYTDFYRARATNIKRKSFLSIGADALEDLVAEYYNLIRL